MANTVARSPIAWETRPDLYRHWQLSFDGPIATVSMDVREDAGLEPGYRLKLNSYDLSVDIELADAIQRIRFEHPEVRVVVLASLKERIFCAGANIFMLGQSSHEHKVNFCKFTNETRLAMEDASAHSGLKFLAALNGICAGGGYELALACDEIVLVDDGHSAVSLPETPLLGVLPGTGGLTRIVDKRRVRRDLADVFGTVAEGIKGRRAVEWRLVDAIAPRSRFADVVRERALALAAQSDRPAGMAGITLGPLTPAITDREVRFSTVRLAFDRERRTADLLVQGPDEPVPATPDAIREAGDRFWPLRAFREIDAALLYLRFEALEIGTITIRTEGNIGAVLAADRLLVEHREHWLVREILHFIKRTLKRLDMTSRSLFAIIEPGSCFAGSLFELALAADRSYMLNDPERANSIALSPMNGGLLPMGNGLSRLQARFFADPSRVDEVLAHGGPFEPGAALEAGLVSFAPDDLDWDDEVRLAIEERASLSPDALTGMEANLRFVGPETLETKIFGRLSAWQNWIFQRPNAVGERGALKVYGSEARAEFDWKRT
ncbi:MAG: 2,3-epoxybenzoyl-CoA dihydrolase [Acidobacteriota bacterium]